MKGIPIRKVHQRLQAGLSARPKVGLCEICSEKPAMGLWKCPTCKWSFRFCPRCHKTNADMAPAAFHEMVHSGALKRIRAAVKPT